MHFKAIKPIEEVFKVRNPFKTAALLSGLKLVFRPTLEVKERTKYKESFTHGHSFFYSQEYFLFIHHPLFSLLKIKSSLSMIGPLDLTSPFALMMGPGVNGLKLELLQGKKLLHTCINVNHSV